ncbi:MULTISPECIES: CCA tRNA nucleotidyltransferase [unclassified Sphingomonas]|uniref:CCA tRNA nucleotidyltransferase n=1 Tax=unclassified Sphingomonas TaxID=196159 RepID=UPI0006FC9776|nr:MULTISPECIES: CCA tRNA nucleotidyltransferase [unclassified Sphingomonas]KQX20159.1 polynucleotide adenylyltransferase [Sphingomonas sp. Root1294]KQY67409.1 polynucleotide adenylyltransferase [Sphingomonas sp. Root50]KRB90787.1 polynucleotide adenylyltransferase [Sphingomonas sp. Root720]
MTILPDAAWQHLAGLDRLLDALGAGQGDVRFVGGAVRDTLLDLPVKDVDCATRLLPEESMRRIAAAGFKPIPTGIAHGTVTAVLPSGLVEVTTLRRDVATDGRHAVVAFTDEWREDAARRDFTINALSADPSTRAVYDYFGGEADLAAGLVRFIGDPLQRIAEDHLRILRLFRFHARFGKGAPDPAAIDACVARANDLMALSRERIADELLKLLGGADPAPTVRLMFDSGIFHPILPEIGADGVARLERLVAREAVAGAAPDPLRRLGALLPADGATAASIARRLKLSKAATRRLEQAASGVDDAPRALAYRFGIEVASDLLLRGERPAETLGLDQLHDWERPRLPIGGGDLIAMGLRPGPAVAATLQAIERRWIAEGFPGDARVERLAAEAMAQAIRDRR